VRLTGRTAAHSELAGGTKTLEEQLATRHGSVAIQIESIEVETRPDVDLEELADGDGPVSYLADLLLVLDENESGEEYSQVVDKAHDTMMGAHNAGPYNLLRREADVEPPDRDAAIEMVEQEARVLLDTLIQQKEDQP
jgi:hypothetical protein